MPKPVRVHIIDIRSLAAEDIELISNDYSERYERSLRFKFDEDRLRSMGAALLLKKSLQVCERDIQYNEYGKPYVAGGPEFNLSHSGNYVALAVADSIVGIDIQLIDNRNIDIADQVFTEAELEWMNDDPQHRFWALWTCKEAVSKAIGKGLSAEFKTFSVLPMVSEENGYIEIEKRRLHCRSLPYEDCFLSLVSEGEFDIEFFI